VNARVARTEVKRWYIDGKMGLETCFEKRKIVLSLWRSKNVNKRYSYLAVSRFVVPDLNLL
jgi:hypothetical protein